MSAKPEAWRRPCGAGVAGVIPGGIAAQVGIEAGDAIARISGHVPADILDYQFWTAPAAVRLLVIKPGGEQLDVEIEKDEDEPLGLTLDGELYDDTRRCVNRCGFCFVDQLPSGLRSSLYLKDDDVRLSVLHGNFVTLTNLTPDDLDRLKEQRLSPLRVSIHTTDLELRREMLGNPKAPPIMDQLAGILGWGIRVHGQIVLCPGVNDGPALARTLADLLTLKPPLSSLAVVPVGVTLHARSGIRQFDQAGAGELLDMLASWQERCRLAGAGGLYAADEFYLLAGRDLPAEEEYGDYPQIENGIGMTRTFITEFAGAAAGRRSVPATAPTGAAGGRRVLLLTGRLFAPLLQDLEARYFSYPGMPEVRVQPCSNELFGPTVTVAGLLSGEDLLRGAGAAPGRWDLVVVPRQAFRAAGDLTLDDMSLGCLRKRLGCRVEAAGSAGELVELVLGTEGSFEGCGR